MDWLGYAVSGGIAAGVVQVLRVILDWRRGAKADERDAKKVTLQARADATTGFAAFTDDLRDQLAQERKRIDGLQVRVDAVDDRRRAAMEYAAQLRQDILDGRPPPPREWPEGLL